MKLTIQEAVAAEKARLLSPLELAFIGDSVHTLLTRTRIADRTRRPNDLHRLSALEVNASAQAEQLARILPYLTEEEADIVRRGRNAHPRHAAPHSFSPDLYRASTALEALYGYLFITGSGDRLACLDDIARGKEEDHG